MASASTQERLEGRDSGKGASKNVFVKMKLLHNSLNRLYRRLAGKRQSGGGLFSVHCALPVCASPCASFHASFQPKTFLLAPFPV